MLFIFLASVQLLTLDKSVTEETLKINDYVLTDDVEELEKYFLPIEFVANMGYNAIKSLKRWPFLALMVESSDPVNQETLRKNSTNKHHRFVGFMLFLWFCKDNAVNINFHSSFCAEIDYCEAVRPMKAFSNCLGRFEPVEFNLTELRSVHEMLGKYNSLSKPVYKTEPSLNHGINQSTFDHIEYNSVHRIGRSVNFIAEARGTSFLPHKIASYVAALECLFTDDVNEVSHKVSERAAHYLGGEANIIFANFLLIKSAYSYRSKYFHGQTLGKLSNREKQEKLSLELDEILRSILKKAILEDSAIFLQKDDLFSKWLNCLPFSL